MSIKEALQQACDEFETRKAQPERVHAEIISKNRERAKGLKKLITETHQVSAIFRELSEQVDDSLILEIPLMDEGNYGITLMWGFVKDEFEGRTYTRWNSITVKSTYKFRGDEQNCPDNSFTVNGTSNGDIISEDTKVTQKRIIESFIERQKRDKALAICEGNKRIVKSKIKKAHVSAEAYKIWLNEYETVSDYFSGKQSLEQNGLLRAIETFKEANKDSEMYYSDPKVGKFAVVLRWNFGKETEKGILCNEIGVIVTALPKQTDQIRIPQDDIGPKTVNARRTLRQNHSFIRPFEIAIWGGKSVRLTLLSGKNKIFMSETQFKQRFSSGILKRPYAEMEDLSIELNIQLQKQAIEQLQNNFHLPFKRRVKDKRSITSIPVIKRDMRVESVKQEFSHLQIVKSASPPAVTNIEDFELQQQIEDQQAIEEEECDAFEYEEQLQQEYLDSHKEHPTDDCYDVDGYWYHGDDCEERPSGD